MQHWVAGYVLFSQEKCCIFLGFCYSRAIFIAGSTTHIKRKQINSTQHLEPGSRISGKKHRFELTFGRWVSSCHTENQWLWNSCTSRETNYRMLRRVSEVDSNVMTINSFVIEYYLKLVLSEGVLSCHSLFALDMWFT